MKKLLEEIIHQVYTKIPSILNQLWPGHLPMAHKEKQAIILYYQKQIDAKIFIETGTYRGAMLWALKDYFRVLYSIEVSKYFFEKALVRFKNINQVHLYFGDSSTVLGAMPKHDENRIYFLDGHYSGGYTEKASLNTPILKELKHIIINESNFKSIIIIDDARLFVGKNDYPSLQDITTFVYKLNECLTVTKEKDLIIIK